MYAPRAPQRNPVYYGHTEEDSLMEYDFHEAIARVLEQSRLYFGL